MSEQEEQHPSIMMLRLIRIRRLGRSQTDFALQAIVECRADLGPGGERLSDSALGNGSTVSRRSGR